MAVSQPLDLTSTFVVVEPDHAAVPVAVTPTVYEELDQRFGGFAGRMLVSSFSCDADWSSWEMHPHGDEVVCLLTGSVDLVLDRNGTHDVVPLRQPGEFVLVPRGTWHTARTAVPSRLLFVTPGEGTRHRPA